MDIIFHPIGTIHTEYTTKAGMPIQPIAGKGGKGVVEILPEYKEGLKDLEGFSYIYFLFYLDRTTKPTMEVRPPMDDKGHGLFATRTPNRPNPIGLSLVKLIKVEGCTLYVEDVDMLDGTPLLDIKPYVPDIDNRDAEHTGWLETRSGRIKDIRLPQQ